MKTKSTTSTLLTKLSYTVAIALCIFSGATATYGLTAFAPQAFCVIAILGFLMECGKVTIFSLAHKPMPRLLKVAMISIGILLCCLNVFVVSGFFSKKYEKQVFEGQATSHTSEQTARASAGLVERQLAASEQNLAAARMMLLKARDDRGRQKSAQAVINTATVERDGLVKQLAAANTNEAMVEGNTIQAGSEMSAIAFLAGATGWSMGTVAHLVIAILAGIPDVLAILLIICAGYSQETSAPVKQEVPQPKLTKRQIGAREGWKKRRQRAYAKNHTLKIVAP